MKKAISILLVITMLLSMAVVPVFAEEGSASGEATDSIATGSTATGNNVTPGSLTEKYQAEGGWTAVATWAELTGALVAGAKIYLTANIDAGTANAGTSNGAKLDGAVIDGNGYTITATGPLFQHTNNTTIQNLTLKSTLSGIAAGATPLAYWETKGYTKVYNVTVESTVTVGANTAGSQSFSGFAIYAQGGSEFKNVIVDTTLDMTNAGLTKANSVGAIAGRANKATFNNCIASGTITVGATAFVDSNQGNNGVGGIVGQEIDACSISNCTNKANIIVTAPTSANNKSVGGIVGYSDGTTLENCLNKGKVQTVADYNVGGMIGTASGATVMNDCINCGDISGGAYAGGLLGNAANAEISGCVNAGRISGGSAYTAGLVAYVGNDKASVANSINLGVVEGTNADNAQPIVKGTLAEECYYLESSFSGASDSGISVSEEEALIKTLNIKSIGIDKAAIDEIASMADRVAANAEYYDGFDEEMFSAAMEDIDALSENPVFTIENGSVTLNFEFRGAAEAAHRALAAEMDKITLSNKAKTELQTAIGGADGFIESNTAIYTTDSWNRFAAALSAARYLVERNMGDVISVLSELSTAKSALKKGGVIFSNEDFSLLDGQDGEFYLQADVTISAPINNFKGTLYGNGHTVTLNGCALFKELNGAKIYELNIKGDAGNSKSLMGKASGEVLVQSVTADTTKLSSAAFFDSAAADAKITVTGAIISSDADIAAVVGNVGCKVVISAVYANGNAPAIVGKIKSGSSITKCYVDGKIFTENGIMISDAKVFASGRVAYVMNAAFEAIKGDLGANAEAFTDLYFVQVIGEDDLPMVGKPLADGTNVVVMSGSDYKNLQEKYTGDTEADANKPFTPDLSKLQEVIARAEALEEAKYTPESFASFKVLLSAAKEALKASTQTEVNSAVTSLSTAIDTLAQIAAVEEQGKVDYSALDEAISKAAELKETDYSKESWAALEAMLLRANMAKSAGEQDDVDTAAEELMGAINGLKAAVVAETEDATEDATEPTEQEGGCGSFIGGTAVMLTAVIALAGISFKKKED